MSEDARLKADILKASHTEGEIQYISTESIGRLAARHSISARQISILALKQGITPLRYERNMGSIGLEGQIKLLEAKVLVAGLGGLGGRAAELLARAGIGSLVLADPDVFDETNLNRQAFADESSLGEKKAPLTAKALEKINSQVDITAEILELNERNLSEMLRGVDVAIDGLDNIEDRLILQNACRSSDVIMVHGAIGGTSLEVATIFPADKGIEDFLKPLEKSSEKDGKSQGIEVELGNLSTTASLAAAIQSQEAIKVITGHGSPLRNVMLYADLWDWSVEFIDLT